MERTSRRRFLGTTSAGAATALGAISGISAGPVRAAEAGPRIRIGQLGTSHSHAAGKLEAIRSLPDLYELVGVAEPLAGQKEKVAAQRSYAGVRWWSEEALLADRSVEVVDVETTLADSARAALACVQAGKHVHLDKPGAAVHAEFRSMRLLAEQRGLTVQMGYMLRYNPAFELLFRAHREGWLGRITGIEASMGKLADAAMQEELAAYPGHGMFELACHLVDAVVHLLGAPSEVHSFSRPTGLAREGLPDHQLAVLEYAQALVTLRCHHGDPMGGPHRHFQVIGTRGAMEIEPLESGQGVLRLMEAHGEFRKGENRLALDVPRSRYAGEFRDLARVVRGEGKLVWSARHDIDVHATALRCAGLRLEG